jgi:hypothetical protein
MEAESSALSRQKYDVKPYVRAAEYSWLKNDFLKPAY